jgi:hypothetical protein
MKTDFLILSVMLGSAGFVACAATSEQPSSEQSVVLAESASIPPSMRPAPTQDCIENGCSVGYCCASDGTVYYCTSSGTAWFLWQLGLSTPAGCCRGSGFYPPDADECANSPAKPPKNPAPNPNPSPNPSPSP